MRLIHLCHQTFHCNFSRYIYKICVSKDVGAVSDSIDKLTDCFVSIEDLGSTLNCRLNTGSSSTEVEIGEFLGLTGQPVHSNWWAVGQWAPVSRWLVVPRKWHQGFFFSLSTCIDTCTFIHRHTHMLSFTRTQTHMHTFSHIQKLTHVCIHKHKPSHKWTPTSNQMNQVKFYLYYILTPFWSNFYMQLTYKINCAWLSKDVHSYFVWHSIGVYYCCC